MAEMNTPVNHQAEDTLPKPQSKAKEFVKKFVKRKPAVISLFFILFLVVIAIIGPYITPYDASTPDYMALLQGPSSTHIWGTDEFGRDVFSRLLAGTRLSLGVALSSVVIGTALGVILGVLAGYYKDTWIETVLMRIVDIFLSVPALVLALAIAAILEPNLRNSMIAITIMWWPWYARLSFGVASSLRTENYIVYAELTGAKLSHIIFKEFLPNTFDQILTKMTLDMGYVICMGATLSFVGLGEQPPTPALGNMINDGVKFLPDMWWLAIFPAATIIIIVLGFNLLGDGVGNIFNVEGK